MALGFVVAAQKQFNENRSLKTSFRKTRFQEELNDFIDSNISNKSEALTWRTCSEEEMEGLKAKIRTQAKLEKLKFLVSILFSTLFATAFLFFLIN